MGLEPDNLVDYKPALPIGQPILHSSNPTNKSWSRRWDSNPQPADYKSAALPIELHRQSTHISVTHQSQWSKDV